MNLKIGFIGMSHLGLNSAAAAAEMKFNVFCYDNNINLIKNLDNGICNVKEPNLESILKKKKNKINFTSNIKNILACDIIYISGDIPTNDKGVSQLQEIRLILNTLSKLITNNTILIILSQIPPGFTRSIKNLFKKQVKIYYQVETLIFGSAIQRAMFPERIIIGSEFPKEPIDKKFNHFLNAFNCPIINMKYESAEFAKISINCFLVSSVSTANTLSEICEHIGADWNEIIPALKLDKRIGQYAYLKPGLGISGGNLERDLATVVKLSKIKKSNIKVINGFLNNSDYKKNWVINKFYEIFEDKTFSPVIAVWGLAYKENTNSIKNSPAIHTINHLKKYQIICYDPKVKIKFEEKNITVVNDPLAAINKADVLLILTPWEDFKIINVQKIIKLMKGNTIIDPLGVLDEDHCLRQKVHYLRMGTTFY